MSKIRLKLLIWALLLAICAAGAWAAVRGAASLLAYFARGADPASALHIVPNVPPDLYIKTSWLPDDADSGRQLDPFTRGEIAAAYQRAWIQWNLSYLKGEPYGLNTYFAGPALAAVGTGVRDSTSAGLRVEQADTVHNLRLRLYSDDGNLVALSDHAAVVAQVIRDRTGAVVFAGETRADYAVVMVLEEGRWHVRHWLRQDASVATAPATPPACTGCVSLMAASGGPKLSLGGRPFMVAGVNYYPRDTPWDTFWAQYSPAISDRDLTRAKGLGLNTIRVFVPFAQFGGPKVTPAMLARLKDLLDRAQAQDMKVIVTLFDFRADYDLLHWPDADRQLETILTQFATHPAVLAWDLKNEPDLDDARVGRAVIDAWLTHVLTEARTYDPNHLLTVGWSSAAAAERLADKVDIVQFHYYAPLPLFRDQYGNLRAAVGARPILLGEFGLPTWNSIFPNAHTEGEQAAHYAEVLGALREGSNVGYLAWTLYDFAAIPPQVAGPWPWQTGPLRFMGIIRSDDSLKPAAALLRPGAPLDATPPARWRQLLKPFWLLTLTLLGGGMAAGVWWLRYNHRQRLLTARATDEGGTHRDTA